MPSSSLTWLLDVPQVQLPEAPTEIPSTTTFTDNEVSDAVDKLVQGSIRRPYGILGERKTLDAFDDTMDAAAGVFILQPAAPFYVILLATRRLNDDMSGVVTSAADLLDAITSTGRRVRPLSNITSLGNARVALSALESATIQRDSAFDDIEDAPAFQRFDKHTDRFLADAATNIRVGEQIAQTPQQARKSLGNLISAMQVAVEDAQRRVRLISAGIENYNSLNLPTLLSQKIISSAREVLDSRLEELEAMTPVQRLEILRETTLDVLASKAVVKGFGSLSKSGTFLQIDGTAQTFSDAEHPGKQATILSTKGDPYVILPGADSLTFTVDSGATLFTVPIQQSFLARLEGTSREPFDIQAGVNDHLRILISDSSTVNLDLTPDGVKTAAEVVAEINADITTQPVFAETFLSPEKFFGIVDAINATGSTVQFVLTGLSWSSLNVATGDGVIVQTGAMTQLYFLVTARSGSTITCTIQGAGTPVNADDITISVGVAGRLVRIRIADGEEEESLTISRTLEVELDTDDAVGPTLGLTPGLVSTCRRTRAEEVASSINASSATTLGGVTRVEAAAVFVGGSETPGRSEPTDPTRIVSSLYQATADVTTPGSSAVFAVAGAATAGVQVGDTLTIRAALVTADVGARGTITAVSDSSVSASMVAASISAGTGLTVEFGRSLNIPKDGIIRILSPSPVAGDYRVSVDEANATEATIDRPLPLYYVNGGRPITFQMQAGDNRVEFKSTSILTDSQLKVEGTAALQFFDNIPVENIGSTRYVLFETDPKRLGVGDRLELYTGQYGTPEYSFEIIGFELGQQLIEVDGDIPNQFIELDFTQQITTPFARIRKVQRNNYDVYKAQLDLWLELDINDGSYFKELNRLINPLIVNDNPTPSAVNIAKLHVQELIQALQQLQVILLSYQVDVVPQVDTLIDSFLQRGSDRAVDTLLEARFTDFFGYNSEEVSYLGNALERLRDVSRLDLPVRRTQRKEVIDQELLLSEHEDPDFEFDQSDIQDTDEPDLPGSFIEIPGGNF